MSDNDARETAATIFDRTAKLAGTLASGTPDPVGAALKIAAGIATAVAGIIRSLGIDGAKAAIDELVARRDEGVITDAHVARDDATIADTVSSMYGDDDDGDDERDDE